MTNRARKADRPGAALLPPVRGHVRLEDVTFGYEPDRPVLHSVSLDVSAGQIVAIVGYTGAGKTTLINLITRSFDPWEGRVFVDGHDVRDMQLTSLRRPARARPAPARPSRIRRPTS